MNTIMPHFFLSFVLFLGLCLRLQAQQHSTAPYLPKGQNPVGTNLIEQACRNAPDKSFCMSILQADKTSAKADMKGLAFNALRAAERKAYGTTLFLKITLDQQQLDNQPGVEDAINNCNEHYLTAIELIEYAINALVSDAPNDVNNLMGAAVADIEACDMSVKGQPGAAANVFDRNLALRRIIANARAVFLVSQSHK